MLPFLKKAMEVSGSDSTELIKRESDDGADVDSLEIAMKELFEAKSDSERAQAFRAAFELLEKDEPLAETP